MTNNLVASTLWHKLMVLQPPVGLIEEIQRKLVSFFWSGQHWIRSAALFLPVQEGGQGLVDIKARIMTFRLQQFRDFCTIIMHPGWKPPLLFLGGQEVWD